MHMNKSNIKPILGLTQKVLIPDPPYDVRRNVGVNNFPTHKVLI